MDFFVRYSFCSPLIEMSVFVLPNGMLDGSNYYSLSKSSFATEATIALFYRQPESRLSL